MSNLNTGVIGDIQTSPQQNKKFQLNGRNLFLTYPKNDGKKEELLAMLLEKLKTYDIQYIIVAEEAHEDGEPHLHSFVSLAKRVCFKRPDCLDFNGKHGDYALAKSCEHSIDYVKKDGNFLEYGKFFTRNDKIAKTIQEKQERNKLLLEEDLTHLVDQGIVSLSQYQTLKKCKTQYIIDKFDATTEGHRDVQAIWIYGNSGLGKSYLAEKLVDTKYYPKAKNHWWDGYTTQETVILNDLDKYHVELGGALKDWGDIYPIPVQVKGATVPARWTKFIVTSQYSIEQIFGQDQQTVDALKRRYTEIHVKDEKDPFGNNLLEYRWAKKREEPKLNVDDVKRRLNQFYSENKVDNLI